MTQHEFLATLRKYTFTDDDRRAILEVTGRVPGFSGAYHYAFYKLCLTELAVQSVLVLGVLYGRDLCLWRDLARRLDKPLRLVGVDRFRNLPCADWEPAQREQGTWEKAGFGTPPDLELARRFVGGEAELVQSDDADYLATTQEKFDLVYLDTAHDYVTVARQVIQALRVLSEGGVLAGDDYTPRTPTWGVDQAVTESCRWHCKFGDDVWCTHRSAVR